MTTKRFLDERASCVDPPNGKRHKTRPSFANVIGEVVMVNFLQNFSSALEPMLRKVVKEEVENGLKRGTRPLLNRLVSMRIEAIEGAPSLELRFLERVNLPMFTGTKILDRESCPLQIEIGNRAGSQWVRATCTPQPIKIEILVIDGDFPFPGADDGVETGDYEKKWTREEFEKSIVKERSGKRPLLCGELQVSMRDGIASVGDIEFTDNSSWIRSRRFRLGARVVSTSTSGHQLRVREAISESFVVKDHRGELYKKHHPPMLKDEVWRLEKIGKDGAFHKKLAFHSVNTVQDLLKMSVVDPSKLRKILGAGMSEKMWEVTMNHARSCVMGSKKYVYHGLGYTIIVNPICQVIKAEVNGQTFPVRHLTIAQRAFLENMVKDAYLNWNSLQEIDGHLTEAPLLLTQGEVVKDEYPSDHHVQNMMRSNQQQHQHAFLTDGSPENNSWLWQSPSLDYRAYEGAVLATTDLMIASCSSHEGIESRSTLKDLGWGGEQSMTGGRATAQGTD
ncbi:hypothetical protein NMG60_11024088 [Bertholletia excelsa]